jgi:hypothetical protein
MLTPIPLEMDEVGPHRVIRIGSVASSLVAFVLVFSSVRGWVVLNFDLPSYGVYAVSSILLICTSAYGFLLRMRFRGRQFILLRNLLLVNLALGVLNIFTEVVLGGTIEHSMAYVIVLPYIIFVFFCTPPRFLQIGFDIIAALISYSVLSNFLYSLSGSEGVAYLNEYYSKLRPDVFEAMSRTGEYFRVGGYTASYHDSANILGMLGSYFFVKGFIERGVLRIGAALGVLGIMTLTQSAANIVFVLLTCLFFLMYIILREKKIGNYLLFIGIVVAVLIIYFYFPASGIFTQRIGEHGDYVGMQNKLSLDMPLSLNFWLGHGYSYGSDFVQTEIGFLKDVFQFGIFHELIVCIILIGPLFVFGRSRWKPAAALPCLAAIVFGFISLGHYGSLFRITNISIFYAMHALFFASMSGERLRESGRALGGQ